MRVAVLSDIHGNLPALEAVLADVERVGVDAIVLNGDLADGPMPAQTLDRLVSLGSRAVWAGGNGDRSLVEAYDGVLPADGGSAGEMARWCAAQITVAHRDRLAALPLTASLHVDALGQVAFCHATGRADDEMVLVDSTVEHFREAFAMIAEDTAVLGHSHMPFDRLVDRRRFVNAGSVGMPYGHSGASWALLGPHVTLCRTGYDPTSAATAFAGTDTMPGLADFIAENVITTPSDAEALTVFRKVMADQATKRNT